MKISNWPLLERPRERLLAQGVQNLTDAELLAIIFRQGSKGQSALDLARHLLNKFHGLRGVLQTDLTTLSKQRGIGYTKYCQLQAAVELGRRHFRENLQEKRIFCNSIQTQEFIMSHLRDLNQEVFAVLFLDNHHRLIQFEKLFYGTINTTTIHPREIIKRALYHNAAAIIISHNHPSGIAKPSQQDCEFTLSLKKILEVIDIKLLDHIIVGENKTISLAEMGLFQDSCESSSS